VTRPDRPSANKIGHLAAYHRVVPVTRSAKQLMTHEHLPTLWHAAPRRWGHPLHSMCSYMAMFPPAIPRVFVEWLTTVGETVWDPFAGRGTTPLEACLAGRVGVGSDANPLAALLTAAKVDPPSLAELNKRLAALTAKRRTLPADAIPDEVRMLFDPTTLAELLWLRSELKPATRADRYLLAVLSGALHANAGRDGIPRGLTVSMPNTFSMSPRYVRRYIDEHRLVAPRKDVLSFLEDRLAKMPPPKLASRGHAWQGSVLDGPQWDDSVEKARLIFTSPPYLRVILYGKYNWLRLWLIGSERRAVDDALFRSSSLPRYLDFMTAAVKSMRVGLRDDGYLCLVIGDVRRGNETLNLAEAVADTCFAESELKVSAVIEDKLPTQHKVSRIWGPGKGRATKTDRVLIATGPGVRLPRVPNSNEFSWLETRCR
jgi:hypothetical protein